MSRVSLLTLVLIDLKPSGTNNRRILHETDESEVGGEREDD